MCVRAGLRVTRTPTWNPAALSNGGGGSRHGQLFVVLLGEGRGSPGIHWRPGGRSHDRCQTETPGVDPSAVPKLHAPSCGCAARPPAGQIGPKPTSCGPKLGRECVEVAPNLARHGSTSKSCQLWSNFCRRPKSGPNRPSSPELTGSGPIPAHNVARNRPILQCQQMWPRVS